MSPDRPDPFAFDPGQLTPTYHPHRPPGSRPPTTLSGGDSLANLFGGPASGPATGVPPAIPGYEIVSVLGRGGMGVVYQARQTKLNRFVALKVVVGGGHSTVGERARLFAEAEVLAAVAHPNIVQVYEVGQHDGQPFLALELCPGGTLTEKLAGESIFPREAARLVEAVARGAEAVHARGVIHRDLKPANILFGPDGTPKVADFGVAKRDDTALTATGDVVGTPSYMAPEQAGDAKRVGPTADVYAIGAILYECLTGRPPFKGPTPASTLIQVLSKEPPALRSLNPRVPADLETVCLKCLDKNPNRRYLSAGALADDLGRFLEGRPVNARPVGPVGRATRWVRRNPVVAGLMAAVAASVFVGVAATYLKYRDEVAQRAAAETARTEADDQRKRAESALDRVRKETSETEVALLRGILRPLGREPRTPLTLDEYGAFGDLAALPDRMRVRFVELALTTPAGAAKLTARRDEVVFAAAGLDREQGVRLRDAAGVTLKNPKAIPPAKFAAAILVPALPPGDADASARAAGVLLDQMTREPNGKLTPLAVENFRPLAPRIEPAAAVPLVKQCSDALVTPPPGSVPLGGLAYNPHVLAAFGQLVGRVPRGTAPGLLSPLVAKWAAEPNAHFANSLGSALAAAGDHLDAADAGHVAAALERGFRTFAPATPSSGDDDGSPGYDVLGPAVAVFDRLPRSSHEAVRDTFVRKVRDGDVAAAADLARRIGQYCPPHLRPLFEPARQEIVARFRAETQPAAVLALTPVAIEVGGRPMAELAVARLTPRYAGETDSGRLHELAGLLAQSAALLPPDQAAAVSATLTGRAAKAAGTPQFFHCLGAAQRVPDPWPADHAAAVAKVVTDGFRAAKTPQELSTWAAQYGPFVRFLTPADADAIAADLADRIAKEPNLTGNGPAPLLGAFTTVAGRLDSRAAAKYLPPLLDRLRAGGTTQQLSGQLNSALSSPVGVLVARLDGDDAEKLFAPEIERACAAPAPPKGYPVRVEALLSSNVSPTAALRVATAILARAAKGDPGAGNLFHQFHAVFHRVDPKAVRGLADEVAARAPKTTNSPASHGFESVRSELLRRLPPDEAKQTAAALFAAVLAEQNPQAVHQRMAALSAVLAHVPESVGGFANDLSARVVSEPRPEMVPALCSALQQFAYQPRIGNGGDKVFDRVIGRAAGEPNRAAAISLLSCGQAYFHRRPGHAAPTGFAGLVARWLREPDRQIRDLIRNLVGPALHGGFRLTVPPDVAARAGEVYTQNTDPQEAPFAAQILGAVADAVPADRVEPLIELGFERLTGVPGRPRHPGVHGQMVMPLVTRAGRARVLALIRAKAQPTDEPESPLLGLIPQMGLPQWASAADTPGWGDDAGEWVLKRLLAEPTPERAFRWLPHLRALVPGMSEWTANRAADQFHDRLAADPDPAFGRVYLDALTSLCRSAGEVVLVRTYKSHGLHPAVAAVVLAEFGRRSGSAPPASLAVAGAAAIGRPFATAWDLAAWMDASRPDLMTRYRTAARTP